MSGIQVKCLCWEWIEGDKDFVQIKDGAEGWRVSGRNGRYHYWLSTDANGKTQWLRVVAGGAGAFRQELTLRRKASGWHDQDDQLLPGSANALDPDIACTALTNTLPIRRLGLAPGESAEIDVLYIPLPDLRPGIVRQRYSRNETGYLYENLNSGFRAKLTVDSAGWVTDYPGVCRMVEPHI